MRQRTTRLFVVAVLALAAAGISTHGEARQGQTVDPALRKAAEARSAARIASDGTAYARYTLDDANVVGPAGALVSTKERVANLKTAKPGMPQKTSDERYQVWGDTAVRTYREDGTNPEGQKGSFRYIEVWVKQGGEWKVAASQVTPVRQP